MMASYSPPYKVLFRAHQWLEFTVNRIGPYIRQFVATKKFEELVAEKQAMFQGNPLFDFLRMKEELTKDIIYSNCYRFDIIKSRRH